MSVYSCTESYPNSPLLFPRVLVFLLVCLFKHFWNTAAVLRYDLPWLVPTLKSSVSGEARALSVLSGGLSSEQRWCYIPLTSWTSLTTAGCILCPQKRDLHQSPSPWSPAAEEVLPGSLPFAAGCRHLCSYPCYQQFLSILEWVLVVSPLPAFQEPKGKESPFSRTALTVSFSLFCEWSHVNHQPLPLEGSPTPQCQCIPLLHRLLGLRLGSLQPSYLQTRAEPACCSLYLAGILPSRNSVSQLQSSQIQDEFMVLANQNFSRLAL